MSKSSQKFQSAHNPSVLLSLEENNSIFSLLSRGQTALATSVIQLLITSPPTHKEWQLFATGVMCFVKHNQKRSYFFRLYDFDEKKMIWEQEIYLDMNYQQLEPYFHMFEAEDCMAGLNFADERDAQHFGLVVRKKADLINKMLRTKDKPNKDRLKEDSIRKIDNNSLKVPNISSMRARSLDSLQTANQNFINIEKSNSKSKLKISKLDIGSPTDFRHIQHIGWSPSTGFDLKVIDPKLQNFFEIAGVSADLLDDIDTRKFIFSFIDTHGGIETAIQEATNQQMAKIEPKNIKALKDEKNDAKSSESNKSTNLLKSISSSSLLPPPPPPPPPPLSIAPIQQNINSQNISRSTAELQIEINSNQIDSPSLTSNASQCGNSRNALLEQIKGGVSLKKATKLEKDSQISASNSKGTSGSLADALSSALQNRFRANQMVHSISDDSDRDNDEFEDFEWSD